MIKQSQIIGNQNAIMEGQRKAAEKQSGYMERGLAETRNSIAEAARSAAAMEGIAKSLSDSAATAQQGLGLMGQMLATNNRIADDNAATYITNNRAMLHVVQLSIEWGQSNPRFTCS